MFTKRGHGLRKVDKQRLSVISLQQMSETYSPQQSKDFLAVCVHCTEHGNWKTYGYVHTP
jgi:hypothetical protein